MSSSDAQTHLALRRRDEDVEPHAGAGGVHHGLHTTLLDEVAQHLRQVGVQVPQLLVAPVLGVGAIADRLLSQSRPRLGPLFCWQQHPLGVPVPLWGVLGRPRVQAGRLTHHRLHPPEILHGCLQGVGQLRGVSTAWGEVACSSSRSVV